MIYKSNNYSDKKKNFVQNSIRIFDNLDIFYIKLRL